jgi:hypothetical protein
MPSKLGTYAIVLAVIDILKTHLQAAIDESIVELVSFGWAPADYAIKAPDSDKGYSDSRILPRDQSPSIRVFEASPGAPIDEIQNLGSKSIRVKQTVHVRIRLHGPTIQETGRALEIVTRAAARVIHEHWRAYYDQTRLNKLESTVDASGPSFFGEDRIESFTTRGRPQQHPESESGLTLECVQRVYAPISVS